ncbi:hypothetical protein NDA11_006856 [Ustilago hordei]|nr:hypothetical protein NDA11_006856 [Ustilago hordei]
MSFWAPTAAPPTASSPPLTPPTFAAPVPTPSLPPAVDHSTQCNVATNIAALHARLDAQADFSSQLASSILEICQLILSLHQDQAQPTSALAPSYPAAAAPVAPSAQPPLATPSSTSPSGELQLHRLFPWISPEVTQLVYDDCLLPHDLGKLRCTSKSCAKPDAASGILVNGICIQLALPLSDAPDVKRFLHQVLDMHTFAQAWTAYTALHCTSTSNPNLCASLSSFLVAVIDHNTKWHWPAVAEYVLTVCKHRFSYTSASDWADNDLSAWQKALGSIPCRNVSTSKSLAKPMTPASAANTPASSSVKRQRQDISSQVCFHFNSTSCPDSSQCQCQHVCETCRGPHPCTSCTNPAANIKKQQQ